MKRRWPARLAGFGALCAALGAGVALFHPVIPNAVVAYDHDGPGSATIVVAGAPSAAFALSGDAAPAALDASSIDDAALRAAWTQALPVERSLVRFTQAFRLTFREDESTSAGEQSHVVAFYPLGCTWLPATIVSTVQDAGLCRSAGHLEIVRQSPQYLKANYSFDKADGYSIAGRRAIRLPQSAEKRSAEIVQGNPVPLLQVPQLAAGVAGRIGDAPHELKQAARLVAYMNEQPVRVGPISAAPDAAADADQRLAAIRGGASAVQCQGFRDIWLELAVRLPGLERVRAVGAYNYFPPFRDLVTYSHALAEIYVRAEDSWILVDPWLGFALRHGGRFLGVADLAALQRNDAAEIEVVPLAAAIRRYSVAGDGSRSPSEAPVEARAMPMRSRFADGRFQFGYLDYFASVAYGPEYRRRAPVAALRSAVSAASH